MKKTRKVWAWSIDVPWKNLCKANRRIPKMFYASKDAALHIANKMPTMAPVVECTITFTLPQPKRKRR